MLISIQTSDNCHAYTRGTYAHPKIIPHFASWLSPAFARNVSKIINEFFDKKDVIIKEKNLTIKKQEGDIMSLTERIDEMIKANQTMIKTSKQTNNELIKTNVKLNKKLDIIIERNDDLQNNVAVITEKLDISPLLIVFTTLSSFAMSNFSVITSILFCRSPFCSIIMITEKLDITKDDRVVKTVNKGDMPALIIMKNPDSATTMKYYAIRTKNKLANQAINKYIKKHKNGKVMFTHDNPNAINYWDRINEGGAIIKRSGNAFKLKPGQTEQRMIKKFQAINDEKYVI